MPLVGKDWSHSGIAHLFCAIKVVSLNAAFLVKLIRTMHSELPTETHLIIGNMKNCISVVLSYY